MGSFGARYGGRYDLKLVVSTSGGGSGGRVKKKIGRSLVDQQLGERKTTFSRNESIGKLRLANINKISGKISLSIKSTVECLLRPLITKGFSHGLISVSNMNESRSQILFGSTHNEAILTFVPSIHEIKANDYKVRKLTKLVEIMNHWRQLENMDMPESRFRSFSFNEVTHDEKLIAFTHSSSFVGNVRYDEDEQSMSVVLNGKRYTFCGVPRRIFDAFEGSTSKGSFFSIQLRGNFDC